MRQKTNGLFTFSIVVADNDVCESAKEITLRYGKVAQYCVEPIQNIARARNLAIANACGDFIGFIDDDEIPGADWLAGHLHTLEETGASGVLGPVRPWFASEAPAWVVKGGFYDRPEYPTGTVLVWQQCRTGNALLREAVLTGCTPPFRPEFESGEDQDFFKRMIQGGHVFVWCSESVVWETVPPIRWQRRFLLKRAIFSGFFSQKTQPTAIIPICEALVRIPLYACGLPFGILLGEATFMMWLFKLCYFLGRLMALVGIKPIKAAYVTE